MLRTTEVLLCLRDGHGPNQLTTRGKQLRPVPLRQLPPHVLALHDLHPRLLQAVLRLCLRLAGRDIHVLG